MTLTPLKKSTDRQVDYILQPAAYSTCNLASEWHKESSGTLLLLTLIEVKGSLR